ncbi:MAG: 4Fe-4S binding protein [Euryarchaeota archaeon]|mgnify:CR=1 FL=1|jgi:ferredoxin|nr:4Fe-4S binding protein [Euryarchaeota archaeon]
MAQAMVKITASECTGCDLCITHCPFEALLPLTECPPNHRKRPVVVIFEKCVGCLSCIGSCPTGALHEISIPIVAELSPLVLMDGETLDVELIQRWGKDGSGWA